MGMSEVMENTNPKLAASRLLDKELRQRQITKIEKLLSDAELGHHAYETVELKGVRDENWPAWYAKFIVKRDLIRILGFTKSYEEDHANDISVISYFLRNLHTAPEGISWAHFAADRLVANFRSLSHL